MLTMALLVLAVGVSSARGFQLGRTPITVRAQGRPLSFSSLLRAAVALLPVALVAVGLLLAAGAMQWRGLLVLAVVFAGIYLLSLPIRHFWEQRQTVDVPTVQTAPAPLRHRLGAGLAAFVPLFVGITVVRATTGQVFYRAEGSWLDRDLVSLCLGIALVIGGSLLAAVAITHLLHWLAAGGRLRRWTLLGLLLVLVALPSGLMVLRSTSLTVAQGLGSAGVFLIFLGA